MSENVLKTLNVGLGERSYPIYIGRDLGSLINQASSKYLGQGKKSGFNNG